ncbi:hypothetical protein [Candidatus Avelusimicrobium fimicolum]|jgi:uncharacterized protein (UPF0333 family)|uniref:hypothetical protein n=1 Tax=Candidatus Avelusimicrobium fimicolum TaxID=3416216 RepID=UPI003D12D4F3
MKNTYERKTFLNKKGQTAVEYIVTAAGLLTALISFYVLYSHLVPQQFDQGAKIILSDYDAN